MRDVIKPSLSIWNYFKGDITAELIVSSIADRMGGYHISYSATELLKDIKVYTPSGKINKYGREIVAHYLHEKYHRNKDSIDIINPTKEMK